MITESIDITGAHKLQFIEEKRKHQYLLNGPIVPGVTTIKKTYPPSDALIRYYIKQGIEEFKSGKKLKRQAAIGTFTHDYAYHKRINRMDLFPPIPKELDQDQVIHRMKLVDKWLDGNTDKLVMAEEIVASIEHQYAGKFDVLVNKHGKLILQDYKSSKGFFEDQFIQLGGYALALKEWKNIEVEGLEVIRFSDDEDEPKSFLIDDCCHIKEFISQFVNLVKTYKFQFVWKTMFEKMYEEEHPYIKKAK